MRERNMVVSDVVEEMNLVFLEKETGSDRVDRSVTPSFVEETAIFVERFEEVDVGL